MICVRCFLRLSTSFISLTRRQLSTWCFLVAIYSMSQLDINHGHKHHCVMSEVVSWCGATLRANFERAGSNQTGYILKAVKHGIQSCLGYKQVEGLTNAFQDCKTIWSSNSFVVIKTCDHFMSIIMSFCGTKGGPNIQEVVWRRFFLQKCQKRRQSRTTQMNNYKSDHVPRTPLQWHMFSSCSWLLSVDSLTYSFVICLCQLSYVTLLWHRHSAQDIPVTTLAGDSALSAIWPHSHCGVWGWPQQDTFLRGGKGFVLSVG